MIGEVLKDFFDMPQVVDTTKRWWLSIMKEIKKMLKMAQRNEISVNVFKNIPIRKDGRNKREQTSKQTIPNNGVCFVHHYWYKKQKVI